MWNRTTTRRTGSTRWALAASAALLMGSAQAQGVASFAPGQPTTASEGGAALTLTVELDAVQTSDVLVPIVASGTAVEGLDYERDVLEGGPGAVEQSTPDGQARGAVERDLDRMIGVDLDRRVPEILGRQRSSDPVGDELGARRPRRTGHPAAIVERAVVPRVVEELSLSRRGRG